MVKLKIQYSVLSEKINKSENLKEFIKETFNLSELQYNFGAKQKIDRFIKTHDTKLKKECHFKRNVFILKNKDWLEREICFDSELSEKVSERQVEAIEGQPVENQENHCDIGISTKRLRSSAKDNTLCKRRRLNKPVSNANSAKNFVRVRKLKSFDNCSRSTKKRRCEKIRSEISESQLNAMFLNYLRSNGRKEDAKIVEKLRSASPNRKSKILTILEVDTDIVPYTPNEALALIADTNLSLYQYELLQHQAKSRNANIYPPYNRVLEAKKECYPVKESITVTETGVNINLQHLLDHTSARLLKSFEHEIELNSQELTVDYKWGLDGASGQSVYKQVFNRSDSTDKSVLMTALVPLQVQTESIVLWRNPRPSSTTYCRPIAFEFVNESKETVIKQSNFIKEQIKSLKASSLVVHGKEVRATHQLELTMVDGKVVDYLTDTYFCNCNICEAKPTQMNDFNCLKQLEINTDNYALGLSTLHCWIRFMECLLHIAYRLGIERTDARGSDKVDVEKRKTDIQNAFRAETGLLLDFVKPGSGTTNDGNTARRFFAKPEDTAKITGLDARLINRFRVILTCLSSGEEIDICKFRNYATETADLYLCLYKWYKMPPSVHKVLIHGADIISSFKLPIGFYSEEAQESRNKDFKKIREHHTRKMNRVVTNEDLIHGLLYSSDPLITSLRTPFPKPKRDMDEEVLQLLK